MVVSVENSSSEQVIQPAVQVTKPIPLGDYKLVGWDLDSTGRHLLDEIVQIAAYTPEKSFSQYVMPYRDVNPIAKKQYNIRVVTIHRYRMLKHNKTNKVIKTKSEISGLVDFLMWLEDIKKDKKGIILVSHEPRQLCPFLILQALEKYGLLERFHAVVSGFANGFLVAEAKCSKTVRRFSLRALSTVLLSKEIELDSAVNRAQLAFDVLHQVCSSEDNSESTSGAGDAANSSIVPLVCQYTESVSTKGEQLAELRKERERQEALRPLFRYLLRLSLRHRRRALQLRQHLLDANITFTELNAAWEQEQLESVKSYLEDKLNKIEEADRTELIQLIEYHYLPETRPKPEPKPKSAYREKRQGRFKSSSTNGTSEENAPKEDAPKEDAPKEDAPKEDAPKEDAPKEDAPKEDAPKEDAPKEEPTSPSTPPSPSTNPPSATVPSATPATNGTGSPSPSTKKEKKQRQKSVSESKEVAAC